MRVTGAAAAAAHSTAPTRRAARSGDVGAERLLADGACSGCRRHRRPRPRRRARALLPLAARSAARVRVYADLPYAGARLRPPPRSREPAGPHDGAGACAASASSPRCAATPRRWPAERAAEPARARRRARASASAAALVDPPQASSCREAGRPSEPGTGRGEAVLWRERRAPPFMQVACALAARARRSRASPRSNLIVTPLAVRRGRRDRAARSPGRGRRTTSRIRC